jgi:decaprenylphospho-beta-D-ribofuranose 2-oxidase
MIQTAPGAAAGAAGGAAAARPRISPAVEVLRGWGEVHQGRSLVYRPDTVDGVGEALRDAASKDLTVAHRGAGQSYGDLAINEGGAVLDLSRLAGIMELDQVAGVVRARAGTTIEALWNETLPRGWWPPVVPGTMKVTLAGAVAANVHGKNHWSAGSIGQHVLALTLMSPDGQIVSLGAPGAPGIGGSIERAIGALGLTGTILDVTLQLHRVHSGLLDVETRATGSLAHTLEALEVGAESWTYAVGWIDCFPKGEPAGRGVLHFARYLPPDHGRAGAALTAREQALPGRILGLVPRSQAWRGLRTFFHDPGMRALNLGRYAGGKRHHGKRSLQPHARFHFLLDYVPGWKRAYLPHGLVQYQLFVPRDAARYALGQALELQRSTGAYSYLGVLKRHRADPFPNAYAMDGFSLALDFPVRPRGLDRMVRLFRSYDALLREVGGRIYAAKDGVSVGTLPADRHPRFSSNLVRRWEARE